VRAAPPAAGRTACTAGRGSSSLPAARGLRCSPRPPPGRVVVRHCCAPSSGAVLAARFVAPSSSAWLPAPATAAPWPAAAWVRGWPRPPGRASTIAQPVDRWAPCCARPSASPPGVAGDRRAPGPPVLVRLHRHCAGRLALDVVGCRGGPGPAGLPSVGSKLAPGGGSGGATPPWRRHRICRGHWDACKPSPHAPPGKSTTPGPRGFATRRCTRPGAGCRRPLSSWRRQLPVAPPRRGCEPPAPPPRRLTPQALGGVAGPRGHPAPLPQVGQLLPPRSPPRRFARSWRLLPAARAAAPGRSVPARPTSCLGPVPPRPPPPALVVPRRTLADPATERRGPLCQLCRWRPGPVPRTPSVGRRAREPALCWRSAQYPERCRGGPASALLVAPPVCAPCCMVRLTV